MEAQCEGLIEDRTQRDEDRQLPDRPTYPLLLTQFVIVSLASSVNFALPAIRRDLDLNPADLQWVQTSYLLAFGGLVMIAGRVAEEGRAARTNAIALSALALTTLGCGLAPSGLWLLAFRSLQGVAAAFASASALTLLTEHGRRTHSLHAAMGAWGAVSGAGATAGIIFGGLVVEATSWPVLFLATVPLILIALAGRRVLPMAAIPVTRSSTRFDLLRTIGLSLVAALVVFACSQIGTSWASVAIPLVIGGLLLGLILWATPRPGDRLSEKERRNRRNSAAAAVLGAGFMGALILGLLAALAVVLSDQYGYSPVASCLLLLPLELATVVCGIPAARWARQRGAGVTLPFGFLVVGTGVALIAIATADTLQTVILVIALSVAGLGLSVAEVASLLINADSGDEADTDLGYLAGRWTASLEVGGAIGIATLLCLVQRNVLETRLVFVAVGIASLVAAASIRYLLRSPRQ